MLEKHPSILKSLTARLSRELAGGRNLYIEDLEEITGGWETQILRLFTRRGHRDGEQEEFILRVYQGAEPDMQAKKEARLLNRLRILDFPVPRVEALVMNGAPIGGPFIVMEMVEGERLDLKLQGEPESEVARRVADMIGLQFRLHQLPWDDLFDTSDTTFVEPERRIPAQLDEMARICREFVLEDFRPTLAWLEARSEGVRSPRLSPLHNDFHPQNVIQRKGANGLCILDWSFAGVGDYRMDLAWTALWTGEMLGGRYHPMVVQVYEEISGAKVEDFRFFEALRLAQRMLTICTWLDEQVEIPIKKITRASLRGEYKPIVLRVYERLVAITGHRIDRIEAL